MTLNKAAWAIDGPTINAALARTEAYAANSGSEGLVQGPDLKVLPLAVAGQGVRIDTGAALILNRYQGLAPDQMYTVTNPTMHTVPSSLMPSANAAAKNYIVAVVIGDPEFSPSGHPFMPSQFPTGQASTFEYVRAMVIEETAFNSRTYPALALARLAIPANTTTITDSMITDLRKLARPRSWMAQGIVAATGAADPLNQVAPTTARFPNVNVITVTIPTWATRVKIMGFVEGLRLDKAGAGSLRPFTSVPAMVGAWTNIDEYIPAKQKDRRTYNLAGNIAIPSTARGTSVAFAVAGCVGGAASANFLTTDTNTSVALSLFFEEEPV